MLHQLISCIYSFMHVDTDETFICFFHLKHCIVELELNVLTLNLNPMVQNVTHSYFLYINN